MTYVMSDLHGAFNRYITMLEKIDFGAEDELYVIGDVVDRGEQPMEILFDMMNRPNVFPLMGNHDLVAMGVLPMLSDTIENNGGKISDNLSEILEVWISDGGLSTITEFCKLNSEQRKDVIDYLNDFTLIETVDIGDNSFVLVHAGLGNYRPDKKFREYTDDDLLFCRPDPSEQHFDDESVYTVMGHTPTPYFSGKPEIYKNGRNIFIDCGACNPEGRLACLCFDTFEEFYV
ncbi:MAG: fructose-bisphosphatase class III [Oscillospiraceae bacterium]